MKYDENIAVAFDFDNTLTKGSTYDATGVIDMRGVRWFNRIKKLGVVTVLWTTRESKDLMEAVSTLAEHGVVFDHINCYPLRESVGKVNVDVYIDDKANDGKIRWLRTYLRIRRLVRRSQNGICK